MRITIYQKELRLGDRQLSDDELIDLMVADPGLIHRPIVEKVRARFSRVPPSVSARSSRRNVRSLPVFGVTRTLDVVRL